MRKYNRKTPSPVDPTQFLNIQTPEVAYILGLLWADGYVLCREKSENDKQRSIILIKLVVNDANYIKDTFLNTGNWRIRTRESSQKGCNRKPQTTIETSNKILAKFLYENDYASKSSASADKILSKIPDNLKHYWFRGLSDGDGCFYLNPDGIHTKYSICSSYEQDWTYLSSLFDLKKWRYKVIRRVQNEKSSSSIFQLTCRKDIINFGNYIYQNYPTDTIGFARKYDKFLQIIELEKQMEQSKIKHPRLKGINNYATNKIYPNQFESIYSGK